jgi:hypothetical protein
MISVIVIREEECIPKRERESLAQRVAVNLEASEVTDKREDGEKP